MAELYRQSRLRLSKLDIPNQAYNPLAYHNSKRTNKMPNYPRSYTEGHYRAERHFVTGQAQPTASTVYPQPIERQQIRATPATRTELIDRYYLDPLRKMGGDQAFIALSLCFLLYEKFLRRTGKMKKGEKFRETAKVFEYIGSDLGVSKRVAFLLWRDWRNGLLHSGMPLTRAGLDWELDGNLTKIVSEDRKKVTLNPWLFRDKVVTKIASKKEIWRDIEAPLMMEYERLSE